MNIWTRIKPHLRRNKNYYIFTVVALFFTGAGLIMLINPETVNDGQETIVYGIAFEVLAIILHFTTDKPRSKQQR